jgi:hypothetical protein
MRSFITCKLHRIIISVIKTRRIRWARHIARMRQVRNVFKILFGKSEGRRPLGRPGIDGRIILEWTGFIYLRIKTSDRLL